MKIAVRYFSMTGNTKKLAEAVAAAVGEQALEVSVPIDERVDVLFLGSSVYAAGVAPEIKAFIASLDSERVGCIVNFSTAALLKSTYKQIGRLAKAQGLKLSAEEFHCRGSFHGAHKGKPDEADIAAVKAFADRIKGEYGNG